MTAATPATPATATAAVQRQGDALLLAIKGRPGARKDAIVGLRGDLLVVDVAAQPIDGRATAHLLRFLADAFAVPPGRVTLVSGVHARWKRVRIDQPQRMPEIIAAALAGAEPSS